MPLDPVSVPPRTRGSQLPSTALSAPVRARAEPSRTLTFSCSLGALVPPPVVFVMIPRSCPQDAAADPAWTTSPPSLGDRINACRKVSLESGIRVCAALEVCERDDGSFVYPENLSALQAVPCNQSFLKLLFRDPASSSSSSYRLGR
jgi:hypothetical protein